MRTDTTTSTGTTSAAEATANGATTSTQPKASVRHVTHVVERAILVPVGAGLLARDNIVSLVTRYGTKTGWERELKRYERRGVTARNKLERRVRRTRTRFERRLRQRRRGVERTVRQNRRRFEREVRSVRRDIEKHSGRVRAGVEQIVATVPGRNSSTS
jgi:hypothetical protein